MPKKCNRCGGEITFRKVDGKTIPIHLSGGCGGGYYGGRYRSTQRVRYVAQPVAATGALDRPQSYLNPNAKCPVCGKSVFFYQSEHGGRVFFDDVGWPWPKHPCTDMSAPQHNKTIYAATGTSSIASTNWTRNYAFFSMVSLTYENDRPRLHLREITEGLTGLLRRWFGNTERTYGFIHGQPENNEVKECDFRDTPNFLIEKSELSSNQAIIQFIHLRKGKVMNLRMRRVDI